MKDKLARLEMLRGFAAVYVFISHFLLDHVIARENPWRWPWSFGQEVVVMFFLLSGFVIYHSVTARPGAMAFGPYLARRARRIFPIFLLALGLAYAVNPPPPPGPTGETWWSLLGNLVMLQDYAPAKPGVWVDTFRANFPLWSLSYEWWFYMLFFPFHRRVPANRQLLTAFALSVLGFTTYQLVPNQLSLFAMYFLLWWGGAELARGWTAGTIGWRAQGPLLMALAAAAALVGGTAAWAVWRRQAPGFGYHPVLEARHFVAALVLVLGALGWARLRWAGFDRVFGPFARVAPLSYALYVFHFPLCIVWQPKLGNVPPAMFLGLAVALTLLAAWVAEVPFQSGVNRLFPLGGGPAPRCRTDVARPVPAAAAIAIIPPP